MAVGGAVKGLGEIKKALDQVKAEHEKKKRKALTRIGVLIKASSVKKTPRDTGNLANSAFFEVNLGDTVTVGYTAAYAAAVHEMTEQRLKGQPREDFGSTKAGVSFGGGTGKGSYWDSGEPKFLEKAIKENQKRIVEELRKGGL